MKLKKAETVKRDWKEQNIESIHLKHHEFERYPQEEECEKKTSVRLGKAMNMTMEETIEVKKKRKKKISMRKPQTDEEEEEVAEIIHFKIDFNKCDSTSTTVIRRRSVTHKRQGESPWEESFEDTFTVPLHQFNLNQLIPKKDTEDIEETVIIEQKIIKETRVSKGT